jgi:predicted DNA-binding transcriptional regulator YafY
MRADRLISILMLLQSRGRLTARQLADALDVSERTIYRDVQALCSSGVPVYAEYGPGGGLALLDSYRTTLTGLDDDELRALFMMFSVPGPLEKLGVSQKLKSALLKVSAALSGGRRMDEDRVRQRFLLDWSWWFHEQEPVPHLQAIQEAVWENIGLRLHYRTILLVSIDVEVEPYGLVSKAGVWYLVAGVRGTPRVYRVSWLVDVEKLEKRFDRPPGFDLQAFWQKWCEEYERQKQIFQVRLRVSPQLLPYLPLLFGRRVIEQVSRSGPPDPDGWVILTLPFENLEAARQQVLNLGSAVEVLEPEALRCSVIDYARQIVNFYEKSGRGG